MATKRVCDCCGSAMGEYDAGAAPVVLRAKGIDLVVQIIPRDGEAPNLRPDCIGKLLADAELVYPARKVVKAGKVVDPGAIEGAEDEAHQPVPMRAVSGGAS